jgi:ubiquitin-like-conjugating enzyme ATG3
MQNLYNNIKSVSLEFATKLTPVLKASKFKETGNITPEEYVVAGDFLIEACGAWKWMPASSKSTEKDFLPADKQYLMTRRVPCYKRCKDIEYDGIHEKIIDIGDGEETGVGNENSEEQWVDTHHNDEYDRPGNGDGVVRGVEALELKDDEEVESDSSEEALDLEDIDDDQIFVKQVDTDQETQVLMTRTYDLHITYDRFYQTPRMWLSGYSESDKPLTNEQTYEDISQDHVNKTVTFEAHPHIEATTMCSIHPCKHANVIKKIMDAMEAGDSGETLQVHMYMVVFLKFIQAAIPTIEYDFTKSVTVN